MGRTLDQVIAELPPDRRKQIEARYQELRQEVEGLRKLRQLAGKAQSDIAAALSIKQPSVSKIEQQADMYLSTLRGYVEAIGGRLDLVVELPNRASVRLRRIGELSEALPAAKHRIAKVRKRISRGKASRIPGGARKKAV